MSGVIEQYSLSDLPIDLLNAIAERLGYVDQIRFRSVCKSWRSNIKPIKHAGDKLPWVMSYVANSDSDDDDDDDYYVFDAGDGLEQKFHNRGLNRYFRFYLYDPYQKKKYEVNNYYLSDSRICATKHGWLLLLRTDTWRTTDPWRMFKSTFIFYTPFINHEIIQLPWNLNMEMIMDGYSTTATFSTTPTSPDCLIFVLTVQSKKLYVSICSRLNNKGKTWRWRNLLFEGDRDLGKVESVAFSRGVFYCLFTKKVMGSFNVEQKQWRLHRYPPLRTNNEQSVLIDHNLIESHDENLFANCTRICRLHTSQEKDCPEVFMYDQVEMKWLEVENLDDSMMFVGLSSVLLPAVEEASELANTIHQASHLGNRSYAYAGLRSSYFHRHQHPHKRMPEHIPTMYDWIENRGISWRIWVQPIKWA